MIRSMLVKFRRWTLCSSVPVGALPVSTRSLVNMDMSTGAVPILGIFFGVTKVELGLTRFVPFFSGFGNSSLKVSIHARNSAPWVGFVCHTFCTLSGTWMPAASPSTWDSCTVGCRRWQVSLPQKIKKCPIKKQGLVSTKYCIKGPWQKSFFSSGAVQVFGPYAHEGVLVQELNAPLVVWSCHPTTGQSSLGSKTLGAILDEQDREAPHSAQGHSMMCSVSGLHGQSLQQLAHNPQCRLH